jgi:hypothetical protein
MMRFVRYPIAKVLFFFGVAMLWLGAHIAGFKFDIDYTVRELEPLPEDLDN